MRPTIDATRKVAISLILDSLRLHHGKPVKARLAEHKQEIEVFLRAQLQFRA